MKFMQYVFLDEIEISKNKKKELEENYKLLFLIFLNIIIQTIFIYLLLIILVNGQQG